MPEGSISLGPLQRRTSDLSRDLEFRPRHGRLDRVNRFFYSSRDLFGANANIDFGAALGGNDVRANTSVDCSDIDRRSGFRIIERVKRLHDVRKFHTIQNGGNHGLLGGEAVTELGYPRLAPLVARHVDLGPWDPAGPVTEVELINYADKRVRHTETVSVQDRFDDLVTRYATTDGARERIEEQRRVTLAVEEKIFRQLPFGPDAV